MVFISWFLWENFAGGAARHRADVLLLEGVAPTLVADPHLACDLLLLEPKLRRLGLGHSPGLLHYLLAHDAGVRPGLH